MIPADYPLDQFTIDRVMNDLPISLVWDQHAQPEALIQALAIEVTFMVNFVPKSPTVSNPCA